MLFRDIGRMVYELHRGDEVTNEEMDAKLAEVDAKQEQLASLREQRPPCARSASARTAAEPARARTASVPAAEPNYDRLNGVRI